MEAKRVLTEDQIRAMDGDKILDLHEAENRMMRLRSFLKGAGMASTDGGVPLWCREAQTELNAIRLMVAEARVHLEERIKELAQE